MSKTTLVTGATGFVGHHLCERLMSLGHTVYALGREWEHKPRCHELITQELGFVDLSKLPKIDVCFHQAANNDTLCNGYSTMCEDNVVLPSKMFLKLADLGCTNFVYASSCSVYGKCETAFSESQVLSPLNAYAKSKLIFDNFAMKFSKQRGIKVVGLRYTNVYGSGEGHKGRRSSMVFQILRKALVGETLELFKDGEQHRDWVYVGDVVDANILAMDSGGSFIANVGRGRARSFNELVSLAKSISKKEIRVKFIDCPFLDRYQEATNVDLSLAKEKLKYEPKIEVEEGMAKIWKSFK